MLHVAGSEFVHNFCLFRVPGYTAAYRTIIVRHGMRLKAVRLMLIGAIVLTIVSGVVIEGAQQQYPVFTTSQLDAAMKTVGAAFTLAQRSAAKGAVDDAKDYLVRAREQVAITVAFWRNAKDDDAVKMLRVTLDAMDDFDAALSTAPVDAVVVSQRTSQVEVACAACHTAHRELDPMTKTYRLRSRPAP